MSNTQRLSITLPAETLEALKKIAHDDWETVSGTVARLVNEESKKRRKRKERKGKS